MRIQLIKCSVYGMLARMRTQDVPNARPLSIALNARCALGL
jgi:hypothetical protein